MRWLVCHPGPHFSVADVYTGYVEALREYGVDVHEFNLGERLTFYASALKQVSGAQGDTEDSHMFARMLTSEQEVIDLAINGLSAALYKIRPDVLLIVSGFLVKPELIEHIRNSGTAVVLLHTESPYEDERQIELAEVANLNLLNDPMNIEAFKEVAPTVYLPHAYRPRVHYSAADITRQISLGEPNRVSRTYDLTFVGTGFESRIEFFSAMLNRFNLELIHDVWYHKPSIALAGNWQNLANDHPLVPYVIHPVPECYDNRAAADLYRASKVGINLYRREAQRPELSFGWAMGPREVEMAACGLFFIRDPRGEGDEVLSMLPTFTEPGEAADMVAFYLRHDNERQRRAELARKAIAERTFHHYAGALLRMIE